MIILENGVEIADTEYEITAVRAQGAGGQNVNKVATAIHLRFSIVDCSLSTFAKKKLMSSSDSRITKDGVLIIKAQEHRSQEKNRLEAIRRLESFLNDGLKVAKRRKPTRPTLGSKKRRLDAKSLKGKIKSLRKNPPLH